ncbi:hypothetical protein [Maridesulfovibrio salexigens]|uniref:EF-hand domain-containing protein n=1 Tax=Maridesulfovibrio salexigens (strain ATCC 14822 / DSM 2638 / NCIMB 8403 / VKM B-1763) TaxID=526222 RepID=C6BWW6_MARSD|nr:hypothetical protein [Maridesulfovibrio salexigens]ACS78446.1 hypothetical protein Desal_0379 [Maridesulfovibrio salexigens DSM 2638]
MGRSVFVVILFLGLAANAIAGSNLNRCFYSMDSNGDEMVTVDEFKAALPDSADVFEEADADKSGALDHDEWESFKSSKGIEEQHNS